MSGSRLDRWRGGVEAERVGRRRSRLGQSITVRPVARRTDGSVIRDAYGKPTYGPSATYPARVAGEVRLVRTASGQERASNTTVELAGDPPITAEDELTLPGGARPPILTVTHEPGVGEDTGTTLIYT